MKRAYCINCDCMVDYEVIESTKTFEVRNVQVEATIKEAHCKECGEILYVREIEVENDISVYDAYKKEVGLLTSKEIIAIRKRRGMSQKQLAKFLKIGEKDITRYENGAIQSKSIDRFIKAIGNDNCFLFLKTVWDAPLEVEMIRSSVLHGAYRPSIESCFVEPKDNYKDTLDVINEGDYHGRRNQVYNGKLLA